MAIDKKIKMLQFEHVTTNPKILGGKPIIKDTRISVEFILELLASGAAVKDIVEAYPHLSEEAVNERGDLVCCFSPAE